jgi:hypothetical protein
MDRFLAHRNVSSASVTHFQLGQRLSLGTFYRGGDPLVSFRSDVHSFNAMCMPVKRVIERVTRPTSISFQCSAGGLKADRIELVLSRCKFFVAARRQKDGSFKVTHKNHCLDHTCLSEHQRSVKAIKSSTVKSACGYDELMPIHGDDKNAQKSLIDVFAEKSGIRVSRRQAYNVLSDERTTSTYSFQEETAKLPAFFQSLQDDDPEGVYILETEILYRANEVTWLEDSVAWCPQEQWTDRIIGKDIHYLNRFFVSSSSMIHSLRHFRRVWFVDGTYLRSVQRGVLLLLVGVDANNHNLILAFSYATAESASNWTWFMRKIVTAFDEATFPSGKGVTVACDSAKGLKAAIDAFPSLRRARDYVHLKGNLKTEFSGLNTDFFNLLQDAMRASTEAEWNSGLASMEKLHAQATARVKENTLVLANFKFIEDDYMHKPLTSNPGVCM